MPNIKLIAPAGFIAGTLIETEFGNYAVAADGTVSVDARAVGALTAAGYTLYDDDLPAGGAVRAGKHTVSSGEDTANTCAIATGLSSVTGYTVMILRAGKVTTNAAAVSESAGTLTIADNATDYVLTAGDVIHWIALGAI